jgi:hypothetical protein
MKLKNLLVCGGIVAMASLMGCVEDDVPKCDAVSSVSVAISSSEVQTKADVATNYTIAKPDEILIDNYLIAIFKDNSCVGFKTKTSAAVNGSTTDDQTGKTVDAYTETFTNLPSGTLKFVVVANYTTTAFDNLGIGTSYSDFENQIETTASFDAKRLLKTGQKEVELEPSSSSQEVKVPLTQLPIRLDFGSVSLASGSGEAVATTDTSYGEWTDILTYDATLVSNVISGPKKKMWVYSSLGSYYYANGYYYYFQKRKVTVTTISPDGAFAVNSMKVSGYNTKTDIFLNPDISQLENSAYEGGTEVDIADSTFYTYEYKDESNAKNMVMTLNCSYSSEGSTVTTYYEYQYIRYYYSYTRGWISDAAVSINYITDKSTSTAGGVTKTNDYTLNIPFNSSTISLLKGHRYTINGTYKSVFSAKPTISWKIVDQEQIDSSMDFD